jgi:hypothetical protein
MVLLALYYRKESITMKDKQIINILMNMMWDNFDGDGDIVVANLVNNGIPINVIAEYYGASETAEYLQKAKDNDLID